MNWRQYAMLLLLGLLVPFGISRFQALPGYMDADYYFAGGLELAKGNGFTQPYLWNYLDDPQGLPHPSHTYWMPLASMVSALGMWLTGGMTFTAGRLPFILLSACVPCLTATLAFDISRNLRLALVSGLLSIFSIYYAPFMPVPDNYALFMLFGGTFLLLAPRGQKWIPFALGVLSGLMTLARSDGLLWLGLAGLTILWKKPLSWKGLLQDSLPAGLLVVLGYSLIMGGWHFRTYTLFDSILTPGGGRLLWLETYNQIFSYPASVITREGFLQAGWTAALDDRWRALSLNAGNLIAAQGGIFLLPFIVAGLWMLRKELRTRIAVTGYGILFLAMTLVFPFAGPRGSFFHAGAAFQPLWWAAAPIGLDLVIRAARKRGLFADNAYVLFQGMLVVLAVSMTFFIVQTRVLGVWGREGQTYAMAEKKFLENGIGREVVVIVGNPPGYYLSSGRPAIALPFGDESVILQVAERYEAGLLVLEDAGTFDAIRDLYDEPAGNSAFIYLGELQDAKLFRIDRED